MKVTVKFEAIVLATQSRDSKDGRKFYNASIFLPESDGEVGSIGISEDAYKKCIPDVKSPVMLTAEYNDKYNSFRIVDVE